MENTCYSAHGFKPLCGIANGGNRFWGDSSDFASIPARTAIGQPLNRSKITQKGLNGRLSRVVSLSSAETRTRSEEHTSELQSLMRISYAVFCLKKKKNHTNKK